MALSQEQKAARRNGIGGSDAAAILGISKWKTPLEVYLDKVLGTSEKDEDNQYIRWGNRLEPVIIAAFEEQTGLKCELEPNMLKHPEHEFMLANIDARIVGQNAILECKTAGQFMAKEWSIEGGDKLPESYMIQCAHYAEVCNVDKVYIAVLIGGSDFRIYHYDRDRKLGEAIIKAEHKFWHENVLKKVPPDPINRDDALKLYNTSIPGESKLATNEIQVLLNDLNRLRGLIKDFEIEYKRKSADIFNFMQTAEILESNSGDKLATWLTQTSNRFDSLAFRNDNPELYDKYIKQSQSRVFRLKGEKE